MGSVDIKKGEKMENSKKIKELGKNIHNLRVLTEILFKAKKYDVAEYWLKEIKKLKMELFTQINITLKGVKN